MWCGVVCVYNVWILLGAVGVAVQGEQTRSLFCLFPSSTERCNVMRCSLKETKNAARNASEYGRSMKVPIVSQPLPSSAPPFLGIISRQFNTDGEAKGVGGRYGVDKVADPGVCGSLRLPWRLSLSDGVVTGSAKIR